MYFQHFIVETSDIFRICAAYANSCSISNNFWGYSFLRISFLVSVVYQFIVYIIYSIYTYYMFQQTCS